MYTLKQWKKKTYYNPQALQSNSSLADLLQSGVDAVPQLLQIGAFPSDGEVLIGPIALFCVVVVVAEGEAELDFAFFAGAADVEEEGEGCGGGEAAREGGNDLECCCWWLWLWWEKV